MLAGEAVAWVEEFERKTEGVEGSLMGEVERRAGEKRKRERVEWWVGELWDPRWRGERMLIEV